MAVFKILCILVLTTFPVLAQENNLREEAETLGIRGSSTQYHELVRSPFKTTLNHSGIIIGIEKADSQKINRPYIRTHDSGRLSLWTEQNAFRNSELDDIRDSHVVRVTNDPKAMFVSHILDYSISKVNGAINTSPLYLAYSNSGFPKGVFPSECVVMSDLSARYENGWDALECLFERLDSRLTQAEHRFTHLVFMSMGWNNNQVESIERYNAITNHMIAEFRSNSEYHSQDFRPLVVGLTWPSVWAGNAFSRTVARAGHIGSYVNKSDDADEIGYTYANYILNNIISRLNKKHKFETVLIGHSMGARILSRAYYSGHLIKPLPVGPEFLHKPKLLVGLQGAFSARRFDSNFKQPIHKKIFHRGEGAPYSIFAPHLGKVILTWSRKDLANPMARYLSGAVHVGGRLGHEYLAKKLSGNFRFVNMLTPTDPSLDCQNDEPIMVDASEFIDDHNDVLDADIGAFLAQSVFCFSRSQ